MEIDEKPGSVWCSHGLEWTWDPDAQHLVSPHGNAEDADAGALPTECGYTFASFESYQAAKERGILP